MNTITRVPGGSFRGQFLPVLLVPMLCVCVTSAERK